MMKSDQDGTPRGASRYESREDELRASVAKLTDQVGLIDRGIKDQRAHLSALKSKASKTARGSFLDKFLRLSIEAGGRTLENLEAIKADTKSMLERCVAELEEAEKS